LFEVTPSDLLSAVGSSVAGLEAHRESPAAAQVQSLIDAAQGLFVRSARPRGLFQAITIPDFEGVYRGEGGNDSETPLEHVIQEAQSLALFAVTVGAEVSRHIDGFFDSGDAADGYILDQIASFAADELATIAAQMFAGREGAGSDQAVLPYSPGYCGWNVSGQRALFVHLEPDELGITLNESCLMHPLKSVSGVLVLAPIAAHDFSPAFPCCASCTTLSCQERISSLRTR
jgi:hypothetical protein